MQTLPNKRRWSPILSIENLEVRNLLSAIMTADLPAPIPESESNDTLDQANDLGDLAAVQVEGAIDRGGIDVDWYQFTLLASSEVTIESTAGVVGLYNSATVDIRDRISPYGHRLLEQASATDSEVASLSRYLAPGTYYVAVSGTGNAYFHPLIADSGLAGAASDYVLAMTATELPPNSGTDPVPLAIDVSPFVVRFSLNGTLDFNPTIELTDANGSSLPILSKNLNARIAELQVFPARVFVPGDYHVVVRDADGVIRGDWQFTVPDEINGVLADQGNDTPDTAIDLGNIEDLGLVQLRGVIGDDPHYSLSDFNQIAGRDVDLYHFQITSSAPIAIQAEVFAGRLGSTLDSGLSLFWLDPSTGHLVLVAGNSRTNNQTRATNGFTPLVNDSAIVTGLVAGDYYIAVADGLNTYDPQDGNVGGVGSGLFDPEQSHSGNLGWTVGSYVLNLQVVPIPDPAKVVSVSIADQSTLPAAPTEFTIQFSQFVNVGELAMRDYLQTTLSGPTGVYIQNARGENFYPRFISFDPTTFEARYAIYDRLPTGSYRLHLSGEQGLANVVGQPILGNSSNGDYVVGFRVSSSSAGTNGNPLVWTHDDDTDAAADTQSLGILFPNELTQGVKLVRTAGSGSNRINDVVDEYSFQVIKDMKIAFFLESNRLPAGALLEVFNADGTTVLRSGGLNEPLILNVLPGTYRVRVSGWNPTSARSMSYRVTLVGINQNDNPPALFSGPAPIVGIRLAPIAGPGGSNPGGVGSGTGGSAGSGLGGGAGSGSAAGLPGISRIDTTLSRLYLDQNGVTRITLPADSNNLVIAIPTLQSNSGGGLGSALQSARSSRRGTTLRDGLAPSGLSELADGPIGKTNRDGKEVSANLTAVQKLSSLIQSALKSKQNVAADDRAQSVTDSRSSAHETISSDSEVELHYDAVDRAARESQGAALPDDGDQLGTTETDASQFSTDIRSIRDGAVETDLPFDGWQDCISIPTSFSGGLTLTDSSHSASLLAPDQVFAAGMGLIAASAVLHPAPATGLSGTRRASGQFDWSSRSAASRSTPRLR